MQQLEQVLLEQYGLRARQMERIDFGIWEESFAVQTDQGPVYAKRFLRKDRKTERMLRGLRLSRQLRAQGFPAPDILLTRDGYLLAETEEGERYQVNQWVEGRTYHPGELPFACTGPMGAVLGRLHRLLGAEPTGEPYAYTPPHTAAEACAELLARYAMRPEPFARIACEVLEQQVTLLQALPADYADRLPLPTLSGPCFHAFWVEQVMFKPDGSVAAVVDWTDGAGSVDYWAEELDTGLHLSVLDRPGLAHFVAGYQSENPLPQSQWLALASMLCYGHLASTNFLGAWFARPYRRMADWETTSALWHRQVVERFRDVDGVTETILAAARS